MKIFNSLLMPALFGGLVFFVSCGSSTKSEPTPEPLDILGVWNRTDTLTNGNSVSEVLRFVDKTPDSTFRLNRDSLDTAGNTVNSLEINGTWSIVDSNIVFVAEDCTDGDFKDVDVSNCTVIDATSFELVDSTILNFKKFYPKRYEGDRDTTFVTTYKR